MSDEWVYNPDNKKWMKQSWIDALNARKTAHKKPKKSTTIKEKSSPPQEEPYVPVKNREGIITVEATESLVPTSDFKYGTYPFEYFNPVQSGIFPYVTEDINAIVASQTASGKAQPLSSKIITPTGVKNMGDMKIDDEIITHDGSITKITGIFPQGEQDVFEITFNDDSKVRCTKDHLWSVYYSKHRHKREGIHRCKVMSLYDIMQKPLYKEEKQKGGTNKKWLFYIPTTLPVQFHQQDITIDPYLLGVLIADGDIGTSRVGASLYEEDVRKKIENIISRDGYELRPFAPSDEDNHNYRITRGYMGRKKNIFRSRLDEYGLKCQSHQKFIPEQYLFNTIEVRIALLQGLMDSDGEIDIKGHAVYTSSSERLINDVKFLIQSLGGTATLGQRIPVYTYKNKKKEGKMSYRLYIKVPHSIPLVTSKKHLSRKISNNVGVFRQIRSIEHVGREVCQCIKVDDPSSLYLTDECIVTHNTISCELFISHVIRALGKKALYVGPLKALVQEKLDDWSHTNHHFHDLKIAICTGDYKMTEQRVEELNAADIIVMTPEMLSARCRNIVSEKSTFLNDLGVVVLDESHLIGMDGRGTHTEVAMMKISQINRDMKIVFLSATMPNVDQVGAWLYSLNGKKSLVISSDYRPCKLNVHYIPYLGKGTYHAKEQSKINTAIDIVENHPDDKFLLFVHGKKTGHALVQELKSRDIEADFHNADAMMDKRLMIENRFKNDPTFRVLVATSTLAWGVNLPARRVIILGLHRGVQKVDVADIQQEIGRAGRPRYDAEGDAYILCPKDEVEATEAWVKAKSPIRSKMIDTTDDSYKELAFHVVNEIYHGTITRADDFHTWFKDSFSNFHGREITNDIIDGVLSSLLHYRAIATNDYEKGESYKATAIGKVASMFYFCPFDVSCLFRNWNYVFSRYPKGVTIPDIDIATALANIDTFNKGAYMADMDREVLEIYNKQYCKHFSGTELNPPRIGTLKYGFMYYEQLHGVIHPYFASQTVGLMQDVERVIEISKALDSLAGRFNRGRFFDILKMRFKYGIEEKYVNLCLIPNIGGARAKALYDSGIKSVSDFCKSDIELLKTTLKFKEDHVLKLLEMASEIHNRYESGLLKI